MTKCLYIIVCNIPHIHMVVWDDTWHFTYNADGLRTQRTNGETTYDYIYNGSQLTHMTVGNAAQTDELHFTYDASGAPMSVILNGSEYYYTLNLQGDIVGICTADGASVVTYSYDAWGNPLSTTGTLVTTLGQINPLRYRGYV